MAHKFSFHLVVTARDRDVVNRIRRAVTDATVDEQDAKMGIQHMAFRELRFSKKGTKKVKT